MLSINTISRCAQHLSHILIRDAAVPPVIIFWDENSSLIVIETLIIAIIRYLKLKAQENRSLKMRRRSDN